LGRHYRQQGDRVQALHHFGKGLEMAKERAQANIAEDPLNAQWIAEAEQALREIE
jgi:hypothetical protein